MEKHWNTRVILMPTLSSLVALEVIMMPPVMTKLASWELCFQWRTLMQMDVTTHVLVRLITLRINTHTLFFHGITSKHFIRISMIRFFLIWLFQVAFLIFSITFFSPYFLLVCFYCSLWLYFSQGTSEVFGITVNWCRVAISNDKLTQWVPSLFCVSFLISFFLK